MKKEKKIFQKPKFIVEEVKGPEHSEIIEFPTETGAKLYEKLLEIEALIKGEVKQEEEPLTEEELKLLDKLQKKAKNVNKK